MTLFKRIISLQIDMDDVPGLPFEVSDPDGSRRRDALSSKNIYNEMHSDIREEVCCQIDVGQEM